MATARLDGGITKVPLRSQMQTETATGTAISNLIKAKQDEVKAIVENIR